MIFGKASTKVPPAATSQTSCQLQSGPIAAMTSRRSASVLATIRCSTPAPISHPSSTTKTITMKHRSANQSSTMRHLVRERLALAVRGHRHCAVGAMRDFPADEIQIRKAEDEVHAWYADEREQHGARIDLFAESCLVPEQAIDEPRLSPELRSEPARRIRNEGKRKREHQHPQHRR